MSNVVRPDEGLLIFSCPHCSDTIVVNVREINCCIFRHAVYKSDASKQIDPHMPKEECDRLVRDDVVYGCAKPFRLVRKSDEPNTFMVQVCDYI